MKLKINEVAKQTGLKASTIRYYDNENLLPSIHRSEAGYRLFDEDDLEALNIIQALKQSGLSIKQIKAFIELIKRGDETLEERSQLFEIQRQSVLEEIQNLQQVLTILEAKCEYYRLAIEAGSESLVPKFKCPGFNCQPESVSQLKQ